MMRDRAGCRSARQKERFEEVYRFLDTWYFFISDNGFFYARPRKSRVSLSEFQSFAQRLDMVCHGEVPNMVVIDLSGLTSKQRFWMKCKPLVCKFAEQSNSVARFECDGSYAAIVIWRRGATTPLSIATMSKCLDRLVCQ